MTPALPDGTRDPDRVVREILRDPVFAHGARTTSAAVESPWAAFWRWVERHVLDPLWHPIERFFRALGTALAGHAHAATLLGIAIDAVILVVLVVAIVRAVRHVTRRRAGETMLLGDPLAERSGRSVDWQCRAREAAARGEFAIAIAALFRSALAVLDARGVVAYDAARTPGEYRRLVRRSRPAVTAPFDALAARFVRATYAAEAPDRADYDAAERDLGELGPGLAS